ncbi:hypothetical protein [Bacillus nitratireducens]|uniref:hypothetical protein n=1 Tax=Bacillus nitratireducens TaxID=2026193 RepID=UPI0016431BA2|nr:hypothetical protein [Bacillus nitratireducens]
MLEIISLAALFLGFILMTYNNYKDGYKGMAFFSGAITIMNLISLINEIGGKF